MTTTTLKPPLTREEAFGLNQALGWVGQEPWALSLAYKLRIWEAFGYESWDEYLAGEQWALGYRLAGQERVTALKLWAELGMSLEAMSRILSPTTPGAGLVNPAEIQAELAAVGIEITQN